TTPARRSTVSAEESSELVGERRRDDAQLIDTALPGGLAVEPLVGERRQPAHVAGALEVFAQQHAHGVALASRGACALGGVEHEVVREGEVAAPRALRAGGGLRGSALEDDTDEPGVGIVEQRDDGVRATGKTRVAPAEVVEGV